MGESQKQDQPQRAGDKPSKTTKPSVKSPNGPKDGSTEANGGKPSFQNQGRGGRGGRGRSGRGGRGRGSAGRSYSGNNGRGGRGKEQNDSKNDNTGVKTGKPAQTSTQGGSETTNSKMAAPAVKEGSKPKEKSSANKNSMSTSTYKEPIENRKNVAGGGVEQKQKAISAKESKTTSDNEKNDKGAGNTSKTEDKRGTGEGRGGRGSGRGSSSGGRGGRGGGGRDGRGRVGGRGRFGRGGRSGGRGTKKFTSDADGDGSTKYMADDHVLIAFMPLLRSKNKEAQVLHDNFMTKKIDEATFIKSARGLLLKHEMSDGKKEPEVDKEGAEDGDDEAPDSFFDDNSKVKGKNDDKTEKDEEMHPKNQPNDSAKIASSGRPETTKAAPRAQNTNSGGSATVAPKQDSTEVARQSLLTLLQNGAASTDESTGKVNTTVQNIATGQAARPSAPISYCAAASAPPKPQPPPKPNTVTRSPPGMSRNRAKATGPAANAAPLPLSSGKPGSNSTSQSSAKRGATNGSKEEKTKPAAQKDAKIVAAPAVHLPKRIMRNQPGKIVVNRVMLPSSFLTRPRDEITAQWYLPLQYAIDLIDKVELEQYEEKKAALLEKSKKSDKEGDGKSDSEGKDELPAPPVPKQHNLETLQKDIVNLLKLKLGLFRVGADVNYSVHSKQNTSIISKDVTGFTVVTAPGNPPNPAASSNNNAAPSDGRPIRYLHGQISFYAPRTPGNVIFRLYSEASPIYTMATGPYMNVHVIDLEDLEVALRFVLSHFKQQSSNRSASESAEKQQGSRSNTPSGKRTGNNSQNTGGKETSRTEDKEKGRFPTPSKDASDKSASETPSSISRSTNSSFASSSVSLAGLYNLNLVLNSWCTTGFAMSTSSPSNNGGGGRSLFGNGHGHYSHNNNATQSLEHDAGRALWGCLCEARKVMESVREELTPKLTSVNERLNEVEKEFKDFKDDLLAQNVENGDVDDDNVDDDILKKVIAVHDSEDKTDAGITDDQGAEKQRIVKKLVAFRKERAALENKLRDAQTAYSSILHIISSNENAMKRLLRSEQLTKLRYEYELWCPICEASAALPRNMSQLAPFLNAKNTMQREKLGFIPADRITVEQLLSSKADMSSRASPSDILKNFGITMRHMYETEIRPSRDFFVSREKVRCQVEKLVNNQCQEHFPKGTRVLVFGSSANGFGSNTSDLDMSLQLPDMNTSDDWFATKGREAMASLAEALEKGGMSDVITDRLTARIPVLKFYCPILAPDGKGEGNEANGEKTIMLECDISMRNPLALLNTQFLQTYAILDTRIPVLAAIIKKWAKARNVNDPSRRTLSSYGYLLMLLHFLLLRRQQGMCLPNLLYTDPKWKAGEVYHELPTRPILSNLLVPHPNETDYIVNAYYYSPRDEEGFHGLQRIVTSGGTAGDTSCEVGVLLARFFRYYAFEFDYKQHIISLHSGGQRSGYVKKETKGEMDGWKAGNTATLAIEDPFEQFYNVGHVVNPIQFQRTRKEFALAYTKIVSSCLGEGAGKDVKTGEELIALLCEPETEANTTEKK